MKRRICTLFTADDVLNFIMLHNLVFLVVNTCIWCSKFYNVLCLVFFCGESSRVGKDLPCSDMFYEGNLCTGSYCFF